MNQTFLFVLIMLASFAVLSILYKIGYWVSDIYKEAKDNNKKIELSSVFISIIALVIALISIFISLQKK